MSVCLLTASSSFLFSDPTDFICSCCKRKLPEGEVDAGTDVSCVLSQGICCLRQLLSTNSIHENVSHEEREWRKLSANCEEDLCDAVKTNSEYDEENLDSGLQISQESTVGSRTELMVANPHRTEDVMPAYDEVSSVPLCVRETFPSTDAETRNLLPGESCEIYKKNQPMGLFIKADILWGNKKQPQEYRSCSPKPNIKSQDDLLVDSIKEKIPADKSAASVSSDQMSGCNSASARNSFVHKDSKENLMTGSDRQQSSVEDLFIKRKLWTEDDQLLTSPQIDDIIQVRGSTSAPPNDGDDVEEATVAKQPVETAATVTDRLVLLDNDTITT